MPNNKIYENWQWFGLWVIFIFAALYSRPLIPIDETRYLSVAWEMWQNNDFLVPHINGEPYSHKPPLLFWFIHLSWFIFGVGEWSGRIVSPLFGLGSIFLTVRLANLLWPGNKDVRQAAPFILLGSSIWSVYSSLAMFDTLLTFFSLLSLTAILEAQKTKSIRPWVWLTAAIGLGLLSKGPVTLLYILPPMCFAPWCYGKAKLSLKRWYSYSLCSLFLGFGIAACWAIPAARAGGQEYEQAILFSQTAGRMVQAFAHDRPFYWYLLLAPLLCLPWFFWFPAWRGWRQTISDCSVRFCLSAILPALLLLSLVSGKQIHYVMPILPIGALLIARLITAVPHQKIYDQIPLFVIFILLSISLFVMPHLSMQGGDREILRHIPKWVAIVPLGSCTILLFPRLHTALGSVKIVASSMIMLTVCLHLAMANPLHKIYDQKAISNAINRVQVEKEIVAVSPANLSDQFQFSGRLITPLVAKNSIHEVADWAQTHQRAFCLIFTKDSRIKELSGARLVWPYKNGWLLFRSATDLYPDYQKWIRAKERKEPLMITRR